MHKLLISTGMILVAGMSLAVEPSGLPPTLTWEKCASLVWESNPSLKVAHASREAARHKITVANADFLPTLSASANLGHRREFETKQGRGSSIEETSGSLSLGLRQSLFSGFRSEANLERTRQEARAAELEAEAADVKITFELRKAFDQLLYYQELLAVNESATQRRQQNVTIVKLRYESGRENKGSLLKAEAALLQAQVDLSQTRRNLDIARSQLGRIIGETIPAETQLVGKLRKVTLAATLPDFATLARASIARRKSIAEVDGAKATIKGERAAYYPELAATANAARGPSTLPPQGVQVEIGLSLTMTLYDGGKTPANVRIAAQDLARTQANLINTEQSVLADLQLTYSNLVDSKERVDLVAKQVDASLLQAQTTRDLYTLGLSTFQAWDQIENDLIANEKSKISSHRDAALALSEWDRTLGRKLLEVGP